MFVRTPLQVKLFPCYDKYNDREISDLKHSWAEIIKAKILPYLGKLEQEFARFFHSRMGRPIKYISLLIVVRIFKDIYDWTDEELLEHVKFDKRFEYAFDLTYNELVLSQKTLHNFRTLLNNEKMGQTVFDRATKDIADIFNIDVSEQRLDSTHIVSNMALLSRLGLFVRVIENLLKKLKKIDPAAYDVLPSRFSERYGRRRGYFADARSKKTKARLGEAANDMYYLLDRFKEHDELVAMKVYEHLQRVFDEHCSVRQTTDNTEITVEEKSINTPSTDDTSSTDEAPAAVTVKEPKDVPPGTLQNPSDEDVTCGHVHYEKETCATCKLAGDCPVKIQKKKAVIRFSPAQLASSIRRREQETKAFKERNNIRAGIEASNSEMKNTQGLEKLKLRGKPRVNQTVMFKALACNVKRMVKYALMELKKAEIAKIEGNMAFSV